MQKKHPFEAPDLTSNVLVKCPILFQCLFICFLTFVACSLWSGYLFLFCPYHFVSNIKNLFEYLCHETSDNKQITTEAFIYYCNSNYLVICCQLNTKRPHQPNMRQIKYCLWLNMNVFRRYETNSPGKSPHLMKGDLVRSQMLIQTSEYDDTYPSSPLRNRNYSILHQWNEQCQMHWKTQKRLETCLCFLKMRIDASESITTIIQLTQPWICLQIGPSKTDQYTL